MKDKPKHTVIPKGRVEELWNSGECVMNDLKKRKARRGMAIINSFDVVDRLSHNPTKNGQLKGIISQGSGNG